MTDTLGRMHSDAQFAGSSSVPAHVEMMGFLGMGNNPMVGATVAVAVAVQQAMKQSIGRIINSFYGDDSFESSPFCVVMWRLLGGRKWSVFWSRLGEFWVEIVFIHKRYSEALFGS